MNPKISVFFLILPFIGCSAIDFIPEPEFTVHHARYKKKHWEEVELVRERPKQPFQILGDIVVRNPESLPLDAFATSIKKALFERKMDGVWIVEKNTSVIDSLSVETLDSRGKQTNSYRSKSTVPFWKGFAYRYK